MSTRAAAVIDLVNELEPVVDPSDRSAPRPRDAAGLVADRAADLFRSYRGGDRAALDSLVGLLTPLIWHIVRAYGLDQASAEDVVQNTWLTLVRKADTVEEPQAVLRWLTVTARRDAWRVARAARKVDLTDDETSLDVREPATSAEGDALRLADDRALWLAVGKLNERCQRLLRVIAFHARPDYAALSHDLDMPVGSIGPTRGRCLDKLRAELASDTTWSRA